MASTDIQKLAEKIARILEAESSSSDLRTLFASIEKINHRLDKLERFASNPPAEIPISKTNHPSLEKFNIAEAIADAVINAKTKEKTCTFEPNGRPCDHCSMCSSRGF
jgi:hypothetical protein